MEAKLINIINTITDSNDDKREFKITEAIRLREDLGMDSFQLAELTVHIEEEFDIDVFEDGIVNTIGEIMKKISNVS